MGESGSEVDGYGNDLSVSARCSEEISPHLERFRGGIYGAAPVRGKVMEREKLRVMARFLAWAAG